MIKNQTLEKDKAFIAKLLELSLQTKLPISDYERGVVISVNRANYGKASSAIVSFTGSPPPFTVYVSGIDGVGVSSQAVVNYKHFEGRKENTAKEIIKVVVAYINDIDPTLLA